jgi:long-chain acyl-CoA synthetase
MTNHDRVWHKWYDDGVPPEVDFEDLTIDQIFDRAVERHADRPAVVFQNGRLSYGQLREHVDSLATALSGMGVGKDDRVAIHLPNLPQTVIGFFATQRLGATAVMTNPLYVPRELEHQWNDAGIDVAITADFLFERHISAMRDRLPARHYVIASIPEYLRFPLNRLAPLRLKRMDPPTYAKVAPGDGIHKFRHLVNATDPEPPSVDIAMDDVALLQYTGGTTGVSKGAQLTHRNISYNVQQVMAWFPTVEPGREVLLAAVPFFHVLGLTVCLNWPVRAGAAMVLMPNPRDIPEMVKNISRHRVTLFPAVPAMFNAINNHPGVDAIDVTSVKACFSGSAPLSEDVQIRFENLTGSKIVEGYGLTETSPVTHANPMWGTRKIGHVGLPVPSTDAKIVDPDTGAEEMPVGREGELIIRGPQVMRGYWQMPEATADMIRDGWLYTGDLAVMDADGYFRIVGRKKDVIIASGYNIYPDEVDGVLMSHPAVLDACTIGVPDERRGETVQAFVVRQPDQQVSEAELIAFCREQLAAYKVPTAIEFRDELPKSAALKTLRRVLRDEVVADS